jgi:branched-chain amino acid transport system permease protein
MEFLQLTATGLVNGMVYALMGFAFIAIFRVTHIINFALGEYFMIGGFGAVVGERLGMPWFVGLLLGVGAAWLLGALLHRTAIQPAGSNASLESLVIITLGASLLLRGAAQLIFGSDPVPVPGISGEAPVAFAGISVLPQAFWIVGIGLLASLALWFYFQHTTGGLTLRASAESRTGASLMGVDTWRTGRRAFALGCALAGLAGVLATPLSFVSFDVGLYIGFKGFTAAVLGGLRSFTAAACGGIVLGLLEAYSSGYLSSAYRDASTFVVLLVVLLTRPAGFSKLRASGHAIVGGTETDDDVRSTDKRHSRQRRTIVVAAVAVAVVPLALSPSVLSTMVFAGLFALVGVGLTLLLGYAGQISLAHAALMGIGAYSSATLVTLHGWSPLAALGVGVAVACAVAWVLSKMLFRLQGLYLAMASMGLAIIFTVIATQTPGVTGGANGIPGVPDFGVGGLTVQGNLEYFWLVWGLVLVSIFIGFNLIDSRFGRAVRAVKGSEAAATALGINNPKIKLQIFVFSAALAAVAGSLYAHFVSITQPGDWDVLQAFQILIIVIVGGMNSLWGAPIGAIFMLVIPNQIQAWLPGTTSGQIDQVLFGVILIAVMVLQPGGLVGWWRVLRRQWRHSKMRTRAASILPTTLLGQLAHKAPASRGNDGGVHEVGAEIALRSREHDAAGLDMDEALLTIDGVSKAFGGVEALKRVSMVVASRSITALIGPNGAGKTTLFNCIAGALRPDAGTIRFANGTPGGIDLVRTASYHAAEAGLARTFQNVQLFGNMTARENVMVGCHPLTRSTAVEGALRIGRHRAETRRVRDRADQWLRFVGLAAVGDRPAKTLPFGHQRLLELARALASEPVLLLLDEPAAGLNQIEKEAFAQLLERVQSLGVSVFIVEHDMTLVMRIAEQIFVFDHGELIAAGPPHQIRQDELVIEAYLGAVPA